ncbi:ATP-binding protein [Streptacidiphilus neutrinimicus]|uniref:ATP-binding protein n=1 Tax=Streptacidiphilus neutrinimicus TaxID=105420 RepID=UPI000A4E82E0|nr:ATP-binding protein [Streptacidiphilus neutrinimicus]
MISLRSAPTGRARLHRYDAPLGTGHGLRHVRDTLARWGLDGDCEQASDAVLVAGELLANARQHGGGAREVELSWHGTRLRIAVSDSNRQTPRLVWPHLPARPSGHGLYLVECLAGRWGAFPQREGKTVWAELRMPTRFGLTAFPRPHVDGSPR